MMARPWLHLVLLALLAVPVSTGLAALRPSEMLADPALEARARDISRGLRCLVCQNQSIDDSNADLARDLRLLVRERLATGDSNRAVLDFVVARYGDYVLLRPPFNASTVALWSLPLLVLLAGSLGALRYLRRSPPPPAPLTAAERARLARLEAEP
jgi:cytochrome c-type biogenesis protein CcmH